MPMAKRTLTTRTPSTKRIKKAKKPLQKADIKQVLNAMLEKKQAITEYPDVLIKPSIPSGAVSNGTGNFFKILPQIDQSVSGEAGMAYNTRIGNEVTLRSLDITGMLSYNGGITTQANLKDSKLAVRVMILRAKDINDTAVLFDNMPTGVLLRYGNQIGGGTSAGVGSYGGFSLDAFRQINRDMFSVRYDEVFELDSPAKFPGTNVAGDSAYGVSPSSTRLFKHKLLFGQNGLKLKYSNITDNQANNFPYFMVIGYSSMASSAQPSNDLVRCTMSFAGRYTDS